MDNKVLETKRRAIQDVVSRVILEGAGDASSTTGGGANTKSDSAAGAGIGIDTQSLLLEDPLLAVNSANSKKIVKQMAVKFSSPTAASAAAAASTSFASP